ncbi:MAG: hypothetical protein QM638_07095 [Nocardioides sp.]|uniref:hypothetical protein n=1 Tax=Nocardioides sp. TaxID=35761 RepID=UPI0039E71C6D
MTQAPAAEVVTYDGLPASAGGAHSLRTKRPDAAWGRVREFLDACTRPTAGPVLAFQVWSGGPAAAAERVASAATERLGGARTRASTHTEWGVRADDADAVTDVLAILAAAGPGAVTKHGNPLASLVVTADVRLIDPATGAPDEDITPDAFGRFCVDGYGRMLGASGVRATIGTTASSLSLWLAFPGDDRLPGAAAHVQEHLPFRLSAKHWRRWRRTRDGGGYRSAKIPSPVSTA